MPTNPSTPGGYRLSSTSAAGMLRRLTIEQEHRATLIELATVLARNAKASWTVIGEARGVSRQAAFQSGSQLMEQWNPNEDREIKAALLAMIEVAQVLETHIAEVADAYRKENWDAVMEHQLKWSKFQARRRLEDASYQIHRRAMVETARQSRELKALRRAQAANQDQPDKPR